MKLEQQVTSLELSKKLKELGVKQEGLFLWTLDESYDKEGTLLMKDGHGHYSLLDEFCSYSFNKYNYNCSAFTVAELGELLPSGLKYHSKQLQDRKNWIVDLYSEKYNWTCVYGKEADERD